MKFLKVYFLLCSFLAYGDEVVVQSYQELVQQLEAACCKTLDTVFSQIQASLQAEEDLVTVQWLARPEIKEIAYNMSNAQIELGFNYVISKKIKDYLEVKIRNEADIMFENNSITVDQAQQFFYISELICQLRQGVDCCRIVHNIKNENFPCIENIKIKNKVAQQAKKEKRQDLCEAIALGALPRS